METYTPKMQKAKVLLFEDFGHTDKTFFDSVDFDDVQLAAEWLTKCRFVKHSKIPMMWTRKYMYALLLSGKSLRMYEKGVELDWEVDLG